MGGDGIVTDWDGLGLGLFGIRIVWDWFGFGIGIEIVWDGIADR